MSKNVSVKRKFSYDENLRKWYQCIYDDVIIIYDEEGEELNIQPGQIVQIQRERTINGWPIVFLNDEDYDMAFEDDEFDEFFEEFDISVFENKLTEQGFKEIFECDSQTMAMIREELLLGMYEDYYMIAVDRMLESALDARGHYLSKGLRCESEIVYYIMLQNKYSGKYTISDWIKDTLRNYPECLDDSFSDLELSEKYGIGRRVIEK